MAESELRIQRILTNQGYSLTMLKSTNRSFPTLCLVITLAVALVCSFFAQARAHGFESIAVSHSHSVTIDEEQGAAPSEIVADDHGHRHGKSHNPADHSHDVPALTQSIDQGFIHEATKLRSWLDQAFQASAVGRLERPPRA